MLSFLFWSAKIKIKNIRQINENNSRKTNLFEKIKQTFFQKNILAKNLALIFLHFILTAPLNLKYSDPFTPPYAPCLSKV
jgi:hypothetical protein